MSRGLLHGTLACGGRCSGSTGKCNAGGGRSWLGRKLLEVGEIARLFRAGLDGRKCQIQLMLHRAGDTVQLPNELFEFFRATEVQAAVPQKADGQHQENRQPDSQCGQYDGEEQGVKRREGFDQWWPPSAGCCP